jgi:hypothetical protein
MQELHAVMKDGNGLERFRKTLHAFHGILQFFDRIEERNQML